MYSTLESEWSKIKKSAHKCSSDELKTIEKQIALWPNAIKKIYWIEDVVHDTWWTEGSEDDIQPWLSLVRTLHTEAHEVYSMPLNSAWEKFGFPYIQRLELVSATSIQDVERVFSRLPNIIDLALIGNITFKRKDWPQFFKILPPLRNLNLRLSHLGNSGIEELVEQQSENLESLNLENTWLGLSGLKKLSRWPKRNQLRHLNLKNNLLNFNNLVYLDDSSILSGLQKLDLTGLMAPGNQFHWLKSDSITTLTIEEEILQGKALKKFVEESDLPNLQRLNVCSGRSIDLIRQQIIDLGWSIEVEKATPTFEFL